MQECDQNQSTFDIHVLFLSFAFEVSGCIRAILTLRAPMSLSRMKFIIFQVY